MIKRLAHIVLSAWLAILLLFGGTSKEFVHLFSGHEDTVHCKNYKDKLVIEEEHHHCTFLQFALSYFVNDVQQIVFPAREVVYPAHKSEVTCHIAYRNVIIPLLRGPPAVPAFLS